MDRTLKAMAYSQKDYTNIFFRIKIVQKDTSNHQYSSDIDLADRKLLTYEEKMLEHFNDAASLSYTKS